MRSWGIVSALPLVLWGALAQPARGAVRRRLTVDVPTHAFAGERIAIEGTDAHAPRGSRAVLEGLTWRWKPVASQPLTEAHSYDFPWTTPGNPGGVDLRVRIVHGRRTIAVSAEHRVSVTLTAEQAQARALAQARARWEKYGATILSSFHSGLNAGQCTDYVASMRPDIIQAVTEWEWDENNLGHHRAAVSSWAADEWAKNASLAGIPEGHVPELNAVIVFQPGQLGAGSSGHVAIVSGLSSNGFVIKEMNGSPPAGGLGKVDERSLIVGTTPGGK